MAGWDLFGRKVDFGRISMDEQFLSPIEVAEILQVKKNTVYEMIKRGDLKGNENGKTVPDRTK